MVIYAFNSISQEAEIGRICEVETSLVYITDFWDYMESSCLKPTIYLWRPSLCCAAQARLELVILRLLPAILWDCRSAPPRPAFATFWIYPFCRFVHVFFVFPESCSL